MTTWSRTMNDYHRGRLNSPWQVGTLRVWFSDDRQYWGISEPGDRDRRNCEVFWKSMGGQIFDGKSWVPM